MSADIAVVIVHYHSEKWLGRCLDSLAQQSVPPRRVIIVNNGGGEQLAAIAASSYPAAEIVGEGENLGFAAANNLAVRRADDCRWIALLNVDAFPERDWLERLAAATAQHPESSVFGGPLILDRNSAQFDGTGDIYHASGRAWRRDQGLSTAKAPRSAERTIGPCAAAALYARSALLEVGGFDERYFCYFEDVDLNLRLRLAGHRYTYVPDARARHIGSATTGMHSDFYIYHGHRNLVWTYVKNMPARLFWRYLPQHLLLNLIAVLFFLWRGKGSVIFRAKRDAVRAIPQMWRARREIQSRRRASAADVAAMMEHGLLRPYHRAKSP